MPTLSGNERLLGARGRVHARLNPLGYVYIEGERWEAIAEDPPLPEDTPIVVTGKDGLRLKVKRDPASIPLLPPAGGAPPASGAPV
jgi:membrane-bound serine protease (ClpP class)